MAEKSAKKKPKKAAKADPSVLGSLRSTRPTRLGGDRRGAARPTRTTSTAATPTGKTSSPAAKSSAAATKPRAAKASGAATQKAAAATKAKASKASGAATQKAAAATKAKAAKSSAPKKPKVRPAPTPPSAPPAGWQVPSDEDGRRDGGPAEVVTTAVQAAGELAQIGLTVGGQLLKRAAGRLPRP